MTPWRSGTFVGTGTFITHPDGSVTQLASGTEKATVLGRSGTMAWTLAGRTSSGGFDHPRVVFSHGTGGLTGVHIEILVTSPSPNSAFDRYSGTVHFDSSP